VKVRVLSALAALLLLAACILWFGIQGFLVLCIIAAVGAAIEYSRVSFDKLDAPLHLRYEFIALCSIVVLATALGGALHAIGAIALASVFFLTMVLMTVKTPQHLAGALSTQSVGLMGLFYCGLFPGLTIRLLKIDSSGIWLFALMAIVFSGDTCAYLAGRAFGKHKLLEPVSPKKTIEGAIGGLIGSGIAGLVLGLVFVKHQPLLLIVFMALVTGAFAQIGDLFESLIKRVADVKDSGSVMPGHGGFLDRLDGLLFAAPVFYVLVRFLLPDAGCDELIFCF
jgi:phosphatidate cytidylyltransferase